MFEQVIQWGEISKYVIHPTLICSTCVLPALDWTCVELDFDKRGFGSPRFSLSSPLGSLSKSLDANWLFRFSVFEDAVLRPEEAPKHQQQRRRTSSHPPFPPHSSQDDRHFRRRSITLPTSAAAAATAPKSTATTDFPICCLPRQCRKIHCKTSPGTYRNDYGLLHSHSLLRGATLSSVLTRRLDLCS